MQVVCMVSCRNSNRARPGHHKYTEMTHWAGFRVRSVSLWCRGRVMFDLCQLATHATCIASFRVGSACFWRWNVSLLCVRHGNSALSNDDIFLKLLYAALIRIYIALLLLCISQIRLYIVLILLYIAHMQRWIAFMLYSSYSAIDGSYYNKKAQRVGIRHGI